MALQIPEELQSKLGDVCRKYAVRELKLFGSSARDDFDPARSDLDLLVEFNTPPEGMRLSAQFFRFHEELQTLFGRHVDLLEGHAIENSRLRKAALSSAVLLYAA